MLKRIKLPNNQFTLIDEKFSNLNKFCWFKSDSGYVVRTLYNNKKVIGRIYLHHEVIGNVPDGMIVDHINGNPLDNRECNLRICTHSQNSKNKKNILKNKTSIYKGVHKVKTGFISQISADTEKIYLGTFNTQEEAAQIYDIASKKYHKEFGSNNSTNVNIIKDWSIYEILPRPKIKREVTLIEIKCSS